MGFIPRREVEKKNRKIPLFSRRRIFPFERPCIHVDVERNAPLAGRAGERGGAGRRDGQLPSGDHRRESGEERSGAVPTLPTREIAREGTAR